jgi:hypothetical protein
MKIFYTQSSKTIFILLFSLMTATSYAQTTLVKGDIAFVGYIGNGTVAGNDQFSFVLLRDIAANTVINFTDNAWLRTSATTGSFTTAEGTVTWTSNAAYIKGTEIKIEMTSSTTAIATYSYLMTSGTAGSAVGTLMPSFSANGDQVTAYRGTSSAPTFISAIHMNSYNAGIVGEPVTNTSQWDGSYNTLNACGLPALTSVSTNNFLTNGVDALWIPGNPVLEYDNSRFNCSGTLTNVAGIRAAVYTLANWTTGDNDAPDFSLPTGCFASSPLPVKLISFQAQNNLSSVITQWQVSNQIDVRHYEVERSFNATNFEKVGTVAAQLGNSTLNYSYQDFTSLRSNASIIYYRLKTVDLNGEFNYSNIVSVRNSKNNNILVDNVINPINDRITFNITLSSPSLINIRLTDANGKLLQTKSLQLSAGRTNINLSDVQGLSTGMYILHINSALGNVVNKLIK